MRILFYISTLKGGGAARVMTNLANRFAEDSNNINKIYFLTNYPAKGEYELRKKIIRDNIDEKKKKENFFTKNIRRCIYLRNFIKKTQPDIVVSFMKENDVRNYVATIGLRNVRTVMSVRNDPNVLFKGTFNKVFYKYIYNRADGVVFQTDDARQWFGKNFKPQNKIILNQTADKFYNIKKISDPKGIVTLGTYLPKKNHKLLIRAYKQVENKTNENLYIYGDGKLKREYKELIAELGINDKVHLCGFSEHPETILSSARLFVLSSDCEGMPNVLLEALASGTPCIATDCPCGGPRTVIDNMVNGILVPPNDEKALSEAIDKVLSDCELQKKLGENARTYSKKFSPKIVYKEWKSFFEEIVGVI